MKEIDPDLIVNWLRADEPGENPRWESKCGVIIQIPPTAQDETYYGFHWPNTEKNFSKISQHTGVYYITFSKAKRSIERQYFMLHPEENVPAY